MLFHNDWDLGSSPEKEVSKLTADERAALVIHETQMVARGLRPVEHVNIEFLGTDHYGVMMYAEKPKFYPIVKV